MANMYASVEDLKKYLYPNQKSKPIVVSLVFGIDVL
jgi:hypothetical protein